MDRPCAIYTTELLCVCFARIYYPRFLRCRYLLDCLNDSVCDDKRRVCMLYVMKWIWKKYNSRTV
jgi:hypothetical protein